MATKPRKFETTSGGEIEAAKQQFAEAAQSVFDPSFTRMIGWPVEVWLRAHSGMLKAVEPAATGWIERRREAVNAALDTFEKLSHCNDLQEAASIQRDWFESTMKRFDTDLHAFADHAMALTHECMSATRDAAQTSQEVAGIAMQSAKQNVARGQEIVQQAADQAAA